MSAMARLKSKVFVFISVTLRLWMTNITITFPMIPVTGKNPENTIRKPVQMQLESTMPSFEQFIADCH